MGWHYVAVWDPKEESYGLHEEFPDLPRDEDDTEGGRSYTINPVTVWGETPEDLAKWLRLAAEDVLKHKPIKE